MINKSFKVSDHKVLILSIKETDNGSFNFTINQTYCDKNVTKIKVGDCAIASAVIMDLTEPEFYAVMNTGIEYAKELKKKKEEKEIK